jgi:hypothetical protein
MTRKYPTPRKSGPTRNWTELTIPAHKKLRDDSPVPPTRSRPRDPLHTPTSLPTRRQLPSNASHPRKQAGLRPRLTPVWDRLIRVESTRKGEGLVLPRMGYAPDGPVRRDRKPEAAWPGGCVA